MSPLSVRATATAAIAPLETVERAPSQGSHTVRLMVVDTHPLVRWALTQIAGESGGLQAVGEAATPEEAVTLAYAIRPDVVTIDCGGADSASWALISTLRERYRDLGIVVLAADPSDVNLFRALNLGASAFVAKSAPIPDVLAAVRHAAAAPSSFTAAGLADALRRKREQTERLALSPREHEILVLLHDGLSVPAVAAQLFVSLSTAKTYVARLYDKLGARNRAQALMTAVRLGLLDNQMSDAG